MHTIEIYSIATRGPLWQTVDGAGSPCPARVGLYSTATTSAVQRLSPFPLEVYAVVMASKNIVMQVPLFLD